MYLKLCSLQALIVVKNGLLSTAEHLRETISTITDLDVYPLFDVIDTTECLKRYKTLHCRVILLIISQFRVIVVVYRSLYTLIVDLTTAVGCFQLQGFVRSVVVCHMSL